MKDLKVFVEGKIAGFEEKTLNGRPARLAHILSGYQVVTAFCRAEDYEKYKTLSEGTPVMVEVRMTWYDGRPGGWFVLDSITPQK